jgi:ABC-type bacteriocin/lantibiotic exporter with double-glycine peptidase domain
MPDLALRLQKASPATVDKDAQLQRVLQLTGVREIIEQLPQGITTDLSDPSVPQLTPGIP